MNLAKGDETAFDYLERTLSNEAFEKYLQRVEKLRKDKMISRAKYNKLRMTVDEIPEGFIDRDLRNSQYIAKKALQMLEDVVKDVNSTTGKITNRLRSDWELIDVMKDLNWTKYDRQGLTYYEEGKNGEKLRRIRNWTKRNDHRHHAMDALTVAFTKKAYVQYLNNLNARSDQNGGIYGIMQKHTYIDERNGHRKRKFKAPMPNLRNEAKQHLESVLISFKAKKQGGDY